MNLIITTRVCQALWGAWSLTLSIDGAEVNVKQFRTVLVIYYFRYRLAN